MNRKPRAKKTRNDNISASLENTTSTLRKRIEMQDLMQWEHLDPNVISEGNNSLIQDPILKGTLNYLSYVFKNEIYASASS